MRAVMTRFVLALATLAIVTLIPGTAFADEPQAQFRLGSGRPHVGVPFQLELVIEGFDESPAPDLPKLAIPDATVTRSARRRTPREASRSSSAAARTPCG